MKVLQKEYHLGRLDRDSLNEDPLGQFRTWFERAVAADMIEPNAMTLATVGANGRPSARVVLLKEYDERGFVFFTSYESRKGEELAENPWAALTFWWGILQQQIRIEGQVQRVNAAESDAYFYSRPRGSQLGAWASCQSKVIESRTQLEQRLQDLGQQYGDGPIPRPPHWGGYRLEPTLLEFWQGRADRLHDCFCYTRQANGRWLIERLAP